MFIRGYEKGASGRAHGFALTWFPSFLMLATMVGAVLTGNDRTD